MATANEIDYEFRDAGSLVKWVRRSLYATLIVLAPVLISGFIEHELLREVRDGADLSEELAAAVDASDIRQAVVGLAQFVIAVVCGVLCLRWIYRADTNARALGAVGLDKTPKWAVAWFFIPIVNLWKPYAAMKQIWQASANPGAWRSETVPSLLAWWWFLYVLQYLSGFASSRLSRRAELVNELITANEATLLSDFLMIPLTLVFLVVVHRIHTMQSGMAARVSVEAPPILPTEFVS